MTNRAVHEADAGGGHGFGHWGPGKYVVVFLVLCLLTAASFFTCSPWWPFRDTPSIGWAFMMAVSCTKAMLVILFFMHLMWEANWKYVLTIPAALMSVFLVCMLIPDIGRRVFRYSEERTVFAAEPGLHAGTTLESHAP
jgi:cytochrome c oxidase subunit 4